MYKTSKWNLFTNAVARDQPDVRLTSYFRYYTTTTVERFLVTIFADGLKCKGGQKVALSSKQKSVVKKKKKKIRSARNDLSKN